MGQEEPVLHDHRNGVQYPVICPTSSDRHTREVQLCLEYAVFAQATQLFLEFRCPVLFALPFDELPDSIQEKQICICLERVSL